MNRIIIILSIGITTAVLYLLLKRKKKKCKYGGNDSCPLSDSDYKKVKTIPPIKCIECNNCAVESNGCCANCNANANLVAESHCSEHNHEHGNHHHHSHQHSSKLENKDVITLIIIPFIMGAIIYRIIK